MSNLALKNDSLIFFLDETGHEELKDSQVPVFGIGGCAIMACDYKTVIDLPWRTLKDSYFDGAMSELHASSIRQPKNNQIEALNVFFKTQVFSRFASVLKTTTSINFEISYYGLVYQSIVKRMEEIMMPYQHFNSVTLIFESSNRTRKMIESHFGNLTISIDSIEIPIERYFMDKSACEPGLEVADFIVHTSGCQVRNHMQGKTRFRKDFEAVYQSIDKRYVSFIDLGKAEFAASQNVSEPNTT